MSNLDLPFGDEPETIETRLDQRDREGRARAVDPRFNVALEASAGTGKTRVLVDRFVNLLKAGVDPSNVLAVTFTRKAAAEMRERIMGSLRESAARGELTPSRWRELRDRTGDIEVSTIDAFCLSLLREFPLEADLDPAFSLADETEVPRLIDESLDRALRICREVARSDEDVALVFAQLGDGRARRGLAALLNRRLLAPDVLRTYLARCPAGLTASGVIASASAALVDVFERMPGGVDAFLRTGPAVPAFAVLAGDLRALIDTYRRGGVPDAGELQTVFGWLRQYFLTKDGKARKKLAIRKDFYLSATNWTAHKAFVTDHADQVRQAWLGFKRDLNALVARGTWRMYQIAEAEYRRTLDAHAVLDFSDVLLRALELVRQMEEFAQSRFRLESRYHHVLVDEFQDTSRPQWELVSLLVQAWGAGVGAAYEGPLPPSIFIVGDRKQSIYGFRDADVSLLQEASRHLEALRPDRDVRRSISRSYRSVAGVLSFVNDVCRDIDKVPGRKDAFQYDEQDRFPLDQAGASDESPLGCIAGETPEACAADTAAEIARLLTSGTVVRDRDTGVRRPITPADIAILFRTRESHRAYEAALEARGINAHVYKGLGFFDADEIKDVRALLWYLADSMSDLRAAAFLRSRFVGLSDEGLRLLAPRLAAALGDAQEPEAVAQLDADDRDTLTDARASCAEWRALVDELPPAELLDRVLRESAYATELAGPRHEQAKENLKKVRSLVRRAQNRGYATLARVAGHLDHLAVGDEANAPIDARDAVSLMTVHASKGLEFPVVFVVNLARGTAPWRDPIRVAADPAADTVSVSVGDFLSEADDDRTPREREETKRLLYVALTRGRDRLYLASVLRDGRVQPGRGSLAEVMPATLLAALASPGDAGPVTWTASSGVVHQLMRCAGDARTTASLVVAPEAAAEVDRSALDTGDLVTVAADALPAHAGRLRGHDLPASDRLRGLAVHRLVQRRGFAPLSAEAEDVAREVLAVIRADEAADLDDRAGFVASVGEAYAALCAREDVAAIYRQGDAFHEVPFSLQDGPTTVRGTIDCLVRASDRRVTVLEFKTGRPRPEHEAQIALYCVAAGRMFPDCTIDSRLIYPQKP